MHTTVQVTVQLLDMPDLHPGWASAVQRPVPDQQRIVLEITPGEIRFCQPVYYYAQLDGGGYSPIVAVGTLPAAPLAGIDRTQLVQYLPVAWTDNNDEWRQLVFRAIAISPRLRNALAVHYPAFMQWYMQTFGAREILGHILQETTRTLAAAWWWSTRPNLPTNCVDFHAARANEAIHELETQLVYFQTAMNDVYAQDMPSWWHKLMHSTETILQNEIARLRNLCDAAAVADVLRQP